MPDQYFTTGLASLSVASGQFEGQAFEPSVYTYTVLVPYDSFNVSVSARASDDQAGVRLVGVRPHRNQVVRGSAAHGTVSMPAIPEITESIGSFYHLTTSFGVMVVSADGSDTQHYTVVLRKKADSFARLENITVEDTPCTLKPSFSPDVLDYRCVFEWWASKTVRIRPHVDDADGHPCKNCELVAPDHRESMDRHLSWFPETSEPIRWPKNLTWERRLYNGEGHHVEFTVVAQDAVHVKTYRVWVQRLAPWYRRTSVARGMSWWSSKIAFVVAFSDNLLNLHNSALIRPLEE